MINESIFKWYNARAVNPERLTKGNMKLHEYQSKTIFSKYGIPIPKGRVAATADEAKQIAEEASKKLLSNPVMEYFEVSVN